MITKGITYDDGRRFVVDAEKLKRAKLLDIIGRVIANPENAREVVEEIALDWFPVVSVDPKGKVTIIVGSGRKA